MSNLKIFAKTIDDKSLEQINKLAGHPAFADAKIRIMPDVHAGAGCVIGFTADLGEKVIPNVVGVDIGCGMLCIKLNKRPSEADLMRLDTLIHERVPSGFNVHEKPISYLSYLNDGTFRCADELIKVDRLRCSLGTLGGGNHFIEVDVDDDGNAYLVIHTGSRNLGKQVAEIYQRKAIKRADPKQRYKEEMTKLIATLKAEGNASLIEDAIHDLRKQFAIEQRGVAPIPHELAYLQGVDMVDYLKDMRWCQRFAHMNRVWIAKIIMDGMGWVDKSSFETVHNYVEFGSHIVRKGAVSAKQGERLIIPMNMRDGSLICVGKGNEDWNCSAPHGAGRLMSRTEARKALSMDDYRQQMQSIVSTSVCAETIDEAPMAYKPMSEIVECIGNTVEIEKVIKPVYNFKAAEELREERKDEEEVRASRRKENSY